MLRRRKSDQITALKNGELAVVEEEVAGFAHAMAKFSVNLREDLRGATGTPTPACFRIPIIYCSTLKRLFRIHTLLGFGRRLTFGLVRKYKSKSPKAR